MTDDIVTRLRQGCFRAVHNEFGNCSKCEAADEIERLQADRDAWRQIADGMAGCLDSSCEAGDLLKDYEKAVLGHE